MYSKLPIGMRLEIMRCDVCESLRGREWIESVGPPPGGGGWKMEYGRAAVRAIIKGILILGEGSRAEIERDIGCKGFGGGPSLALSPNEGLAGEKVSYH